STPSIIPAGPPPAIAQVVVMRWSVMVPTRVPLARRHSIALAERRTQWVPSHSRGAASFLPHPDCYSAGMPQSARLLLAIAMLILPVAEATVVPAMAQTGPAAASTGAA